MKLDEQSEKIVRELGNAINAAVEKSECVMRAVEDLRRLGYEPNLSLKLKIDLSGMTRETAEREVETEFTDEDLRTLQKMKISLE